MEKLEDSSDCKPDTRARVPDITDVTDVPVRLSSVVTEFCDGFSCYSNWEDVVPQSFSFSPRKRAHCCTSTQEEMTYESSRVKASIIKKKNDAAHATANLE